MKTKLVLLSIFTVITISACDNELLEEAATTSTPTTITSVTAEPSPTTAPTSIIVPSPTLSVSAQIDQSIADYQQRLKDLTQRRDDLVLTPGSDGQVGEVGDKGDTGPAGEKGLDWNKSDSEQFISVVLESAYGDIDNIEDPLEFFNRYNNKLEVFKTNLQSTLDLLPEMEVK